MSIEILHSGLRIDGRPVPLLSGSMHYWRVRPTHWEECLLQLKGLGLPIVTTYVPWSVHEVERDVFDFGERDPQKNLAGFVQLAAELGLFVMLRPGPHINAELTDFGFPSRVLDDVRVQACGPDGEPIILPAAPKAFPAPSYASEKFWKEMEGWFRAAAGIIEPLTHPNGGPVVGLQCDNELSYFFRTGAYDQDYSDGALAAYHGFLEERYGDAATVGDAYGIGVTNFREIQPPTEFAAKAAFSLPYYLDWMEFRERLLGGALARMRLLWESMGVRDILFTHNLPTCLPGTPFNIPRDERSLHVVGIDFYPRRKDYPNVKQRTRALEGVSRLPFSPEFTAGAYQLWPPLTLEDQEFAAMATLMHGLRGYNFYMAVERERWYGSPITRTGAQRPGAYESLREFVAFLKDAEMLELEMEARVLLLAPRIYDRLEKAATLFGNLPPIVMEDVPPEYVVSEHPLGFEHCVQIEASRMRRAYQTALEELGITYRLGDSESRLEGLRGHDIVLCPTFEFMDDALQSDLVALLEGGGALVMGPAVPNRAEDMKELSRLDHYVARPEKKLDCAIETISFNNPHGALYLLTEPLKPGSKEARECVARIMTDARVRPSFPVAPPCERTVFRHRGRTVVFVANPTDEARVAELPIGDGMVLRDLRENISYGGQPTTRVPMRPWHIRAMEVLPC